MRRKEGRKQGRKEGRTPSLHCYKIGLEQWRKKGSVAGGPSSRVPSSFSKIQHPGPPLAQPFIENGVEK